MNGRCHNDPMDFATDVCDSCGDQFCSTCLIFPRGERKPPLCTNCAMALSGVRNRRPVKPLPRAEIKKRRKNLKAELSDQGDIESGLPKLPGSDLIDPPEVAAMVERRDPDREPSKLMSRFRRRKNDTPLEEDELEELTPLPEPVVTIVGGSEELPPPPSADDYIESADDHEYEPAPDGFEPTPPEHSSATAILEQLKEQEGTGDENVWLPPAANESTPWTLPDLQQSPLGTSGPWDGVASQAAAPQFNEAGPEDAAPMFVSEAQLEAAAAAPPEPSRQPNLITAPHEPGTADTDQGGNWVPPNLRGMAPQAGSNGDELPRRRRRTEPSGE